jgi:hypothetical protein
MFVHQHRARTEAIRKEILHNRADDRALGDGKDLSRAGCCLPGGGHAAVSSKAADKTDPRADAEQANRFPTVDSRGSAITLRHTKRLLERVNLKPLDVEIRSGC